MSAKTVRDISEKIVKASKELYEHGLVRGTSGNISARIPGTDTFLIKPSGGYMKLLKPEELVLVDLEGNKIRGESNVSMETPIHAAIYRARKDVQAVVHTHAPTATAFGIARKEILPLQIEMFMLLPRGVPIVPFELPGSKALAEAVRKKIMDYDAVVLENHGIVTVGSTIAAKIQFTAIVLAGKANISQAELEEKFKTLSDIK
jgi:ribulose-5-phosphate 4-epimerase/fuculose-1-phosphate aldolase